jgi:hypothetical protein
VGGWETKNQTDQEAEEKVIVLVIKGLHQCESNLLTVQNYDTSDLLYTAKKILRESLTSTNAATALLTYVSRHNIL